MDASTRTLQIAFIGNCIEQGDDLPTGASYVELVSTAIGQNLPNADIRFRKVLLRNWMFLGHAVDECVAMGTDIVVIGAGTMPILVPRVSHRLETPLYGPFHRARRAAKAIEARISKDPTLLRAFGGLRKLDQVLWFSEPAVTVPEYLLSLEDAVTRLRRAHSRVIVRGPTGVENLTEGKDGQGLSSAVARACERMGVPYVIGEALIEKRPQAMVLGYGGKLNELGHSVLAAELILVLKQEITGTLSEPVRAFALPRRKRRALAL